MVVYGFVGYFGGVCEVIDGVGCVVVFGEVCGGGFEDVLSCFGGVGSGCLWYGIFFMCGLYVF